MATPHTGDRVDLAAQLADLAKQATSVQSLDELLHTVTTAATELVDGADEADILLIESRKKFRSHAPTSDLPVRLDELQQQTGQGPCVDAALNQTMVRANNLATDTRWPEFAPAAINAGVYSILSYTLYSGGGSLGALNLIAKRVNAFDDQDEEIGLMLATHCAIAFDAVNKHEQFQSALASRDIIGQAKGMIMERFGVDATRAFELLRKLSQDSNTPLATVAAQLVESGPAQPS